MSSSYIKFSQFINYKLNTILECGSRDCLDAIEMFKHYNPQIVYSFECNPESIQVCKQNIIDYPSIHLIEKALSDKDGEIDFYATDMEKSLDKNIGASSALVHSGGQTTFIQKKIKVPCVSLDAFYNEYKLNEIDLLCLDLQGYEKVALEGFRHNIHKVKYIISEVSFTNYYYGNVLFDEYRAFLNELNFDLVAVDPYEHFLYKQHFADALFVNRSK